MDYTYLIFIIITFGSILAVNYYFKFVNRNAVCECPPLIVLLIASAVFWPLTLSIAIAAFFIWIIVRYLIPK
jgi:hypothetical protein